MHLHQKGANNKLFIDKEDIGCYHDVVKSLGNCANAQFAMGNEKEDLNERSNNSAFCQEDERKQDA